MSPNPTFSILLANFQQLGGATVPFIRSMGRGAMTGLVINSIIGSGIFGMPSELNRLLGRASPLAMVFAALGMAIITSATVEVATVPLIQSRSYSSFQSGSLSHRSRFLAPFRPEPGPSFLRFILGDKARRTQGWLTTAILGDAPLENTIDMVIARDMFLPVGTFLHGFRISA
jgi:amino acid transporter